MAFKLQIKNPFGLNTLENGYVRLTQPIFDTLARKGNLIFSVWKSMDCKNANIDPEAEWRPKKLGIAVVFVGNSIVENGVTVSVPYADVFDKTIAEINTYMKSKKILFENQVLDLSLSEEVADD
jgi:hypothetical protein